MSDQTTTSTAPVESSSPETSIDAAVEQATEANTEATTEKKAEAKAKAEEQKRIKKLRLKVDQKEYDEELPFEIPDDDKAKEYMTRQLQMAKMGQKRAQDYAVLDKEIRAFINDLKTNPKKILTDPNIGVDLRELAKSVIEEDIANSQKTPEQLEKEKKEAELMAQKEQWEKERETLLKQQFEMMQQQAYEKYDTEISNALEKSNVPKSPYVINKMVEYMLVGLKNNVVLSADEVVPIVQKEIQDDVKQMFSSMKEDDVEEFIGKEIINKLRKKNLEKAKAAKPLVPASKTLDVSSGKKEDTSKSKISYRDFFKLSSKP